MTIRNEFISHRISDFLRTKSIIYLFAAVILIFKQKRSLEIIYGIYCFLCFKPSKIKKDLGFSLTNYIPQLAKCLANKKCDKENIILEISKYIGEGGGQFATTEHGHVQTESGFIVGEYAENSARLFYKINNELKVYQFYQTEQGVRHIHSILKSGDLLFISTGDSSKFLDIWRFKGESIVFDKRIIGKFGGFTTCCEINGRKYFGTDFSERPNYIYCLETKKKYFFPKPAYTKICKIMIPVNARYLFCINIENVPLSIQQTLTVFDTWTLSFIYSQDSGGGTCIHISTVW